ncbi:signal peptidase I [Cellulomonas sp. WB94]|uniref:signal peptidase I n=1 Tax=Cellulomonas sp. WB94 TaxID=2173174 RepID=UPI000D56C678|nr:signal peptidase I [Cellulomonas sp. WB94]PVU82600.1 signal peptidase I [Cellulomonas sp. WB94]
MTRLVRVAGESMAPTYRASDLLLTRRVGRAGVRARRGDVVVFHRGGLRMVKRVVGLPGDLVELEAGRLFVNGESVDGRSRVRGAFTQTRHVPASSYFMAGDNVDVSDDSRIWDEPFVGVESVDAVVLRKLWGRRRVWGLAPGRRAPGPLTRPTGRRTVEVAIPARPSNGRAAP